MAWRPHELFSAMAVRLGRLARRFVNLAITAFVSLVCGFTLYAVLALPALKPWHTQPLDREFSALRDANLDF